MVLLHALQAQETLVLVPDQRPSRRWRSRRPSAWLRQTVPTGGADRSCASGAIASVPSCGQTLLCPPRRRPCQRPCSLLCQEGRALPVHLLFPSCCNSLPLRLSLEGTIRP